MITITIMLYKKILCKHKNNLERAVCFTFFEKILYISKQLKKSILSIFKNALYETSSIDCFFFTEKTHV